MKNTVKTAESTYRRVLRRVARNGVGWVFTARDFLDYGSRDTLDTILSRLCKKGRIRRIARGIYDCPKVHPQIGMLSPDPIKVAKAIATNRNAKLQASGAFSANLLGLTEQVPAQIIFLTDSDPKIIRIGKSAIKLKHTAPSSLIGSGSVLGDIIQAIKYLGKDNITDSVIQKLRSGMSAKDKDMLMKYKAKLPFWMHSIIDTIANH